MGFYRNLAFASVSLMAFATPAFAQDTAAKDSDEGAYASSDIVVEARRKEESAQDVPLVVNAVTADSINKLNIRDFKDITSVVPGLTISANANGIGTTSSVRGVNFDVNASGNSGTIEYYLNDSPISSGQLFLAMYDVAQIEVLRGPQGTLRGRASPSGSITIANRKPNMSDIGVAAQVTANDIGGYNGNAAMNLPIIQDVLAIRVAGLYDWNEGNRVLSLNSTEKPSSETQSGRISVRATPTDFLELNASYTKSVRNVTNFDQVASFSEFSSTAPASAVLIKASDRKAIMYGPRVFSQRFETFNWSAALRLAGQKLNYVGSYNRQKMRTHEVSDATGFFKKDYGQDTLTYAYRESHEIRLQNEERIAGMFDYVVGYFTDSLNSPTTLGSPTAIGLPNGTLAAVSLTPVERFGPSKEDSYFGNLTVHFGEATEISGGVRHIKYRWQSGLKVSGNVLSNLFNGCTAAANCAPREKWIYSAAVKHRVNENVMAYASFGTSWRAPINVVGDFSTGQSAREQGFLNLDAETSKSYELGLKTDWMDKRLRLNVTVYQQDFENFPYRSSSSINYISYGFVPQLNATVPSAAQFNFVGAVPVRVRGIEADGSFQVTPEWTIGSSLNYAKGKVNNGLMPCNDLNGDGQPDVNTGATTLAQLQAAYGANNLGACRVNYRSANAPVWSGVVNTEYDRAISANKNAYVRGLWSWQSKTGNDPANPYDNIRANSTLNLYLGVRDHDGAWDVSLFGKNVLNNQTVTSVSNGPLVTNYRNAAAGFAASTASSTYAGINMVAPREFGITARFALGSR